MIVRCEPAMEPSSAAIWSRGRPVASATAAQSSFVQVFGVLAKPCVCASMNFWSNTVPGAASSASSSRWPNAWKKKSGQVRPADPDLQEVVGQGGSLAVRRSRAAGS